MSILHGNNGFDSAALGLTFLTYSFHQDMSASIGRLNRLSQERLTVWLTDRQLKHYYSLHVFSAIRVSLSFRSDFRG